MRERAREIYDLERARDFALGVVDDLAVFAGEDLAELRGVFFHQRAEGEEDLGAFAQRSASPRRLCGLGGRNGPVDGCLVGKSDTRLHLAARRVVDVAETGESSPKGLPPMKCAIVRSLTGACIRRYSPWRRSRAPGSFTSR